MKINNMHVTYFHEFQIHQVFSQKNASFFSKEL